MAAEKEVGTLPGVKMATKKNQLEWESMVLPGVKMATEKEPGVKMAAEKIQE